MAIAWNFGFGRPFQKHFGTLISRTLQHFNGKSTDYFVDSKEYEKFNKGLEHLLERDEFINSAYQEAREFLEMAQKWSELAFSVDLKGLKSNELAGLYKKFTLEMQPSFYARMWMVYRLSHPLEAVVERMLLEATRSEEKTNKLLKIFSTPLKPSNVQEERIDALIIALKRGKVRIDEYDNLVHSHFEKYAYIPMYGFDHEPFSFEHFMNEIGAIRDPKKEFREFAAALRRKNIAYEKALMELKMPNRLARILKFYSDMIYLRDYRDMLREKVNFSARRMYLEIALRAGLDLEEINLLTNDEIINFLNKGKLPQREQVRGRKHEWLILQEGEKISIYSGKEARAIARKEIGITSANDVSTLLGRIGSPGFATGFARIIHTNKDLIKIKEGDIMATSMTRQDFVPYLRKCAALVTDEGGITSHAAIICRELGIPCLVGTEFATITFTNGEMLEVNANKGFVRRIMK